MQSKPKSNNSNSVSLTKWMIEASIRTQCLLNEWMCKSYPLLMALDSQISFIRLFVASLFLSLFLIHKWERKKKPQTSKQTHKGLGIEKRKGSHIHLPHLGPNLESHAKLMGCKKTTRIWDHHHRDDGSKLWINQKQQASFFPDPGVHNPLILSVYLSEW